VSVLVKTPPSRRVKRIWRVLAADRVIDQFMAAVPWAMPELVPPMVMSEVPAFSTFIKKVLPAQRLKPFLPPVPFPPSQLMPH